MSCFCHFAGFEVKDAKARKAIDEIKTNAKKAYSASGGEDMGVEMTHVSGGADAYKELWLRDVRYDKNAGMVYVRLVLIFEGQMQGGEEMRFVDNTGHLYMPRPSSGIYPLTTLDASNVRFGNGNDFVAYLQADGIYILPTDQIFDTGSETAITISGCYPYDEEDE